MSIDRAGEEQQRQAELVELREINNWKTIENDKNRKHEKEMKNLDIQGSIDIKKLEASAATARLKASTRSDAWRNTIINIIKLPTLPFAVFFIFLLELRRHDIPEALENFIDLR